MTATSQAASVYALGSSSGETARLQRQSEELRTEAALLIDRLSLRSGQSAIDIGCGPAGILDLLSAAVSPAGRTVGLDSDPSHITQARRHAERSGLDGVEVVIADARHTGLPAGSFDLVHARTLLVTIPEPEEVLAEMVRLAKPGGIVVSQEPDVGYSICYPPIAAWDRLSEVFRAGFTRSGADLTLGRRLTELYRQAGLADIEVMTHATTYPAGHSRRTLIPDLVRSLHPVLLERGLAGEAELAELDLAVRRHLADPSTLMMPHLLFAVWGRKPALSAGR